MDIDDVFEGMFCVLVFVLVILFEFVCSSQLKIHIHDSVSVFVFVLFLAVCLFFALSVAGLNQFLFYKIYTSIFWVIGFVHYLLGWMLRIRRNGVIPSISKMIKTPYSLEEEEETLVKRFEGMKISDSVDSSMSLYAIFLNARFKKFWHFDLF